MKSIKEKQQAIGHLEVTNGRVECLLNSLNVAIKKRQWTVAGNDATILLSETAHLIQEIIQIQACDLDEIIELQGYVNKAKCFNIRSVHWNEKKNRAIELSKEPSSSVTSLAICVVCQMNEIEKRFGW